MSRTQITYKAVDIDETAEWGDYRHLMQRWQGLTASTAKQFTKEMREHAEFSQYVHNPTHKIVFVNYKGFELFIQWKARNRYKTKKETLADMLKSLNLEDTLGGAYGR